MRHGRRAVFDLARLASEQDRLDIARARDEWVAKAQVGQPKASHQRPVTDWLNTFRGNDLERNNTLQVGL